MHCYFMASAFIAATLLNDVTLYHTDRGVSIFLGRGREIRTIYNEYATTHLSSVGSYKPTIKQATIESQATNEQQNIRHLASPKYIV